MGACSSGVGAVGHASSGHDSQLTQVQRCVELIEHADVLELSCHSSIPPKDGIIAL